VFEVDIHREELDEYQPFFVKKMLNNISYLLNSNFIAIMRLTLKANTF